MSIVKILLVEDNADKNRQVLRGLAKFVENNPQNIDNARDALEAKRLLRTNQYDLVVLDIALPERNDSDPSPTGGIELLREVLERDIYLKPTHIVGLTAFDDIFEQAGAVFGEDMWSVIKYESSSEEWLEKLGRKIRYISLTKSGSIKSFGFESTLCVVVALPDPELDAVLRIPWKWKPIERPEDCTIYYGGEYGTGDETRSVIAAAAPRMGMTAAAALTMKMITTFKPQYVAMVGILAGVKGQCQMGDIVAADPAWDYGSGKFQTKEGISSFAAFPYQLGLDPYLRANLSRIAQDVHLMDDIRRSWSGLKPETVLKMHIAPVACGAAVLADEKIVEDRIQAQNRKVTGIDMETYGVMGAADEAPLPSPKAFCLKSVCDFANPDKSNNWQAFAAYTSARVLQSFAERFLS